MSEYVVRRTIVVRLEWHRKPDLKAFIRRLEFDTYMEYPQIRNDLYRLFDKIFPKYKNDDVSIRERFAGVTIYINLSSTGDPGYHCSGMTSYFNKNPDGERVINEMYDVVWNYVESIMG